MGHCSSVSAPDRCAVTVHALSADEFAEYAREQIRIADALIARHRPANRNLCQCGRPLPCTQAEAVRAHKDHYLARLGLAEATVSLPVVTSAPAPPRTGGMRALLPRMARRNR